MKYLFLVLVLFASNLKAECTHYVICFDDHYNSYKTIDCRFALEAAEELLNIKLENNKSADCYISEEPIEN